ncbi:hypothetical protein SCOCK_210014 [Actinacidiphila cocklensis]|uniref:Uncharacterized protein n=1 Tax=Actinacidiphila cocklensis TaxID=887465 RepID=A0A9W4GQG9_9ACTN|nr:hypothetical protein SCOCK_210014 [Actinacidiphila cocklensis]
MALRSRLSGGGFKPPSVALAEDCRGEQEGKGVQEASGGDQEGVASKASRGVRRGSVVRYEVASKPGL